MGYWNDILKFNVPVSEISAIITISRRGRCSS